MLRIAKALGTLCLCAVAACGLYSDPESGRELSPGLFSKTIGQMRRGHIGAVVVLLDSGKVLVAGGMCNLDGPLANAEIYDPADRSFTPVANTLSVERFRAAGCKLADGRVLITGGVDQNYDMLATADVYDPDTNSFVQTAGVMMVPRSEHSATVLEDGTVLVAGGFQATIEPHGVLDSAETFDPSTGRFTPAAGPMTTERASSAAVRLSDGRVLLAGGSTDAYLLDTAELYDPTTRTFSATVGIMTSGRVYPNATLLPDGRALVSGGNEFGSTVDTAELYDPSTQTFAATQNPMSAPRFKHFSVVIPDGRVLVGGGFTFFGFLGPTVSVDFFDPATNGFAPAADLNMPRAYAPGVLLPDGSVLIIGGADDGGLSLANGESCDPAAIAFTVTGGMTAARTFASAVTLPGGSVLIAGGEDDNGEPLASAEVFDPNTGQSLRTRGPLSQLRVDATTAPLQDGRVLVTGGTFADADAEVYDPATRTFVPTTGPMSSVRVGHTATALPDGTVLLAGGVSAVAQPPLASAELYDPSTNDFVPVPGSMVAARVSHAAALLHDGRVLLVGGTGDGKYVGAMASAEIYDPATRTFSATGSLSAARLDHTATALRGGQVLVVGGVDADLEVHDTAEVYHPSEGVFRAAGGSMQDPRFSHTATEMHNGAILVTGGWTYLEPTLKEPLLCSGTADLYDPVRNVFAPASPMMDRRAQHTASPLPDGRVLLSGGSFDSSGTHFMLNTTEVFTP